MTFKGFIKLAIVIAIGVWLYSSGKVQYVMNYFSQDDSSSSSSIQSVSFEKGSLLNLIDHQGRLADNIVDARRNNSRDEVKRLFAQFEEFEAEYQTQFRQAESKLTAAEATEISRKHRDVMRRLN